MEERINLREFQSRLAERLKEVGGKGGSGSKLGFVAGGRHWLIDLDQVSEVVTVSRLTPAPWVKPWFLGVAGVRGMIYACTDLAAFLGLADPLIQDEMRLLLANPRFGVNAALRVDRALGLRSVSGMRYLGAGEGELPWELARFEDGNGTPWVEISIEHLVTHPQFLQAAR